MSVAPVGSGRFEDLALAIYLEEVVRGRRALWIGDASTQAPDRLAERAQAVLVLDPREQPAIRREGGLRVSLLRPGPLQFRPGSFDLAVVPDLSVFDAAAADRLDDLRDAVGEDGLVAVAVKAKEGAFDVFYDLVSERFACVRWVGQAPFAGVAVADFEPSGDDDILVDGSLLDVAEQEQAPKRYVAICSASPRPAVPYTVVQCPGAALLGAVASTAPAGADDAADAREQALRDERQSAEVEQAHALAEELEAELAQRDRRLRELEEALADSRRLESRSTDASSADAEVDPDYEHLERTLAERARDLLALRSEIERRGVLVRDLVQENVELRRASGATPGPGNGSSGGPGAGAERDRIIERALEAEARWTEARFRADELQARLASVGRDIFGVAEPSGASELDPVLQGTVRGLRSRVAELEEMRELAEGRLALASAELDAASRRHRVLERDHAELQERFELELVRARGASGEAVEPAKLRRLEAAERELAAQVGELSGQLVVCREHAESLVAERDRARAEALKLTSYVVSVEDRLEGMRLGYERRIAELLDEDAVSAGASGELVRLSNELYGLRGEREGLQARLGDREMALRILRRASGSHQEQDQRLAQTADELDAARERLEELESQHGTLTTRLIDVEERAARQAERAADLTSAMAARDALVTRLQMDLAEQEQLTRSAQEQLGRLTADHQRMRDALVEASQAVDERDRLVAELAALGSELEGHRSRAAELERDSGVARSRLQRLEEGHGGALETLRELRSLLSELPSPDPRTGASHEITAVGMEAPAGDAAQGGGDAPERVAALERTLQERDEQLRSLQRRLEAERAPDAYAEALQREMMEMQERVARLSEELEHERAARRAAESQPPQSAADRDAELTRLQSLLGDRSVEVEKMRGRVATFERDVHAMRKTCADAKHGLEELLGAATASGDPSTAERIGSLLRLLSRF